MLLYARKRCLMWYAFAAAAGEGKKAQHGGQDGGSEAFCSRGYAGARQPRKAHVPLAVQDFPSQRAHSGKQGFSVSKDFVKHIINRAVLLVFGS